MARPDNLLLFPTPSAVDQSEHDPHDEVTTGGNDGGGMGGGNDGLEPRVARLEDSVARIEKDVLELKSDVHDLKIDVAGIKSQLQHFATKSDLSDMKADMIKWIVGTALAMSAAGITVMTFVLNNAIPKTEKASPPPVIINVPPQK